MASTANLIELAAQIRNTQASKYAGAAALIVVVYDHLLTLKYEVNLFWKAQWSLVKILFLLNRWSIPAFLFLAAYDLAGLAGPLTDHFCQRWFIITLFFMQFSIYSLIYLLQLRVFALFKQDRRVIIIFMALYYTSWAASFSILVVSTVQLMPKLIYMPELQTCGMTSKPEMVRFIWTASFALELLSFASFGIKAAMHYSQGEATTPLLKRLCKDGIRYCIGLLGLRILNVVIWLSAPPTLLPMSVFIFWAATAICVNHVLLELRRVVVPDQNATKQELPFSDGSKMNGHTDKHQSTISTFIMSFNSSRSTTPLAPQKIYQYQQRYESQLAETVTAQEDC